MKDPCFNIWPILTQDSKDPRTATLVCLTSAVSHCINFFHIDFQLSWQHQNCKNFPSDKLEQRWGCKQITVFFMWKTSALLSGIFPLQTTLEVGLVRAPPQDSHPPIPNTCTVWARRTTSWGEERNRQQCLLELENWLHNLNFSLTTMLLH